MVENPERRRVLVSGGSGFIGSNFIEYLMKKYPEDIVCNLDCGTYAASDYNTKDNRDLPNYRHSPVDLRDREEVDHLVRKFDPHLVFNLAAETHVDNSINGPDKFVQTNIVGAYNLLDTCRIWWDVNDLFNQRRYVQISSDEVFGALGPDDPKFCEKTRYNPRNPYSASKASADHLVMSYVNTYGMDCVITNCSNNFGPKQHDEKYIPTIIRKCLAGEKIPIYGKGEQVRDWLFVWDHCSALDLVSQKGKTGESYCIGGDNERKNIDVALMICVVLTDLTIEDCYRGFAHPFAFSDLMSFVADRPGHDFRYGMDATKIKTDLGWKPRVDWYQGIEATVRWYLDRVQFYFNKIL